jgi:hypothetical protein
MKQLKSITFTNIIPEETYLVSIEEYERYGGEGPDLFKATGKQIIKKIEEAFDFRSWMDTEVEETGKEPKNPTKSFLKWAMDMNGYGDDYIQVFKF